MMGISMILGLNPNGFDNEEGKCYDKEKLERSDET